MANYKIVEVTIT